MKQGYKFVYSLTIDSNVFYIGCTIDVVSRYRQHVGLYTCASGKDLREYLVNLSQQGKYPDLHIIDYLPTLEALKLEATITRYLIATGHKMMNSRNIAHLARSPAHMPDNPTFTEMLKAVKYKRTVYLRHKMGTDIINGIWQPFPLSPFETK